MFNKGVRYYRMGKFAHGGTLEAFINYLSGCKSMLLNDDFFPMHGWLPNIISAVLVMINEAFPSV